MYRTLAGRPLLDTPGRFQTQHAAGIAAVLGGFLAALHAIPVDLVEGCVDVDDDPAAQWLADAIESYQAAFPIVPVGCRPDRGVPRRRPTVGDHELVFSHNDSGIEHVLVDPETAAVTGILDWTDAALVDPAYDFGLLQRDLGPIALDAALANYPANNRDAIGERAGFYARCSVLEDLAWGDAAGREPYVRRVWQHSAGCSRSSSAQLWSDDPVSSGTPMFRIGVPAELKCG